MSNTNMSQVELPVKPKSSPFSKYFPATEEQYNDPEAVALWDSKVAFQRNHCGDDYVLMEESYVPRLPDCDHPLPAYEIVKLFDTSQWTPTAKEHTDFYLDGMYQAKWNALSEEERKSYLEEGGTRIPDADLEGWCEYRAAKIYNASRNAPSAQEIEDVLAFDPRDRDYQEGERQRDERLLIDDLMNRAEYDDLANVLADGRNLPAEVIEEIKSVGEKAAEQRARLERYEAKAAKIGMSPKPRWFDAVKESKASAFPKRPVRPPPSIISAASLHGKPVPERQWVVENMIPGRNVTDISADGGTGKSLLALQLLVGVTCTGNWLDMPIMVTWTEGRLPVPTTGPAIYFSA